MCKGMRVTSCNLRFKISTWVIGCEEWLVTRMFPLRGLPPILSIGMMNSTPPLPLYSYFSMFSCLYSFPDPQSIRLPYGEWGVWTLTHHLFLTSNFFPCFLFVPLLLSLRRSLFTAENREAELEPIIFSSLLLFCVLLSFLFSRPSGGPVSLHGVGWLSSNPLSSSPDPKAILFPCGE